MGYGCNELFEIIYNAALTKDTKTILGLIKAGQCLIVFKGIDNPVSLLAREGHFDAINFLINIHYKSLIAILDEAAYGYAAGGYLTQCEGLLGRGASFYSAIQGHAERGDSVQVEKLLTQYKDADNSKHFEAIKKAIFGYAKGGHEVQVQNIINLYDETQDQYFYIYSINIAVDGFASGGHRSLANHFRTLNPCSYIPIISYTQTGQIKPDEIEVAYFLAYFNDAIFGYAQGGYVAEVENVLDKYEQINLNIFYIPRVYDSVRTEYYNVAIRGYALGGHVDQVEDLLNRGANINHALSGYVEQGHIQQVENLLLRGADLNCLQVDKINFRRGFFDSDYILNILTFIDDPKARDLVAMSKILIRQPFDISSLEKQAILLNRTLAMNIDLKIWLLQGIQLVNNNEIPFELFIHIASYVLSASLKETEAVYSALSSRFRINNTTRFGLFRLESVMMPGSQQIDKGMGQLPLSK